MQRNAVCWVAIILAGCILSSAGCQLPGVRNIGRASLEDRDRPLSNRQVADVQLTLARSLEQQGKMEQALEAYRTAVEKDPRRTTGYWRMANLLSRMGQFEESEVMYQEALKRQAKNPDLLCDYGYSLYLQRRWAESEERLRQAIALKPTHKRAHNHLGLVLAQAEQSDAALAEFRKAGCTVAEARSNLALVMTLNHRWDDAREQYERALDSDPNSATAQTGLENLESVLAKVEPNAGNFKLTSFAREVDDNPEDSGTGRGLFPQSK
jgi:Tfp pilus assembly protein PilF